jgi:DNA-binding CsgD family transcriptional regulator
VSTQVTRWVVGIRPNVGMKNISPLHPSVRHPLGRSPMVNQLVAEWAAMSVKPSVLRHVNEWGLPGGPFTRLDQVLEQCGFGHEATFNDGDRCLAQVIARASHDELAARIVLQRILPPIISIAARRGRIVKGGFNEAFSTTLGHAWILIRTYPLDRRPAKIASNLVRDAEYHAFVREARLKRVTECSLTERVITTRPSDTSPSEHDELQGVLDATPHLTRQQKEVVRRCAQGHTFDDIAKDYGVTARTVRGWKREAIKTLRTNSIQLRG